MSKAILVIDVPSEHEELIYNHTIVSLINWKTLSTFTIHNVPLKPLPQKKEIVYSKSLDYCDGYFAEGYNTCLNEICRIECKGWNEFAEDYCEKQYKEKEKCRLGEEE